MPDITDPFELISITESVTARFTHNISVSETVGVSDYVVAIKNTNDAEFTVPLAELDAEGTYGGTASFDVLLPEVSSLGGALSGFEVPVAELGASGSQINLGSASFDVLHPTLASTTGALCENSVPLVELVASGVVGASGTAGIAVPVAELTASGTAPIVGTGSFSVPVVSIIGEAGFVNQGNADFSVPRVDLDISGYVGTVGNGSVSVPLLQLSATGSFAPTGTASITVPLAVLEATATGSISIVSQVEETESETFALSINLSNNAVSEYLNYKFNSQTYFNGKYIGANTSGIFDLTGDDDAGTSIASKIRTGLDDVGSYNLKRVWGIYLSHNGEALWIRTTTETEDFDTIAGTKNRASMSVQKFRTQRTKRNGYWGVEVTNLGGTDFTISGLEVVYEILNRRAV